ncbi:unnamed protein product [Didymodactylos carnosus]|uniref:Metallo-beta-lactamase domain-containing protein n=1 Tax=Didymodactylos carnosus TaxID=1234261 RepID=A0A815QNV7_9BILA|nr:unnamed protein product [Didymodactylos carnosus]CAF1464599.1 unnamed protein product [Didymodactylos carnosus]CAF4123295.1 unnamed protein product [Didymodactylos carnosus]CAF4334041.1 unnamed protein product [Didymodactylos carnosus]
MTSVRRLYVMLCGFEIIPKTVSTRNLGANIIMSEPISAYLLDTTEGWILIDTGLDETRVDDPILAQTYFVNRGWKPPPVVLSVHRLRYQLSLLGLEPQMISRVILTHTHADHTGNLKYFRHAKIYIQRKEYEHSFRPQGELGCACIREDYDYPDIDWHLMDGDWSVVPGLDMISTPGHTPGHQSARVVLPSGNIFILPADAGDLLENFRDEILPGESVDDEAALKSIRLLNQLASEHNACLFLGHDPVFIQTIKLAPDYYD